MIDQLKSLKQDLFGRRLLPVLALAALALVGAVAYAALGGGGSSSPATASVAGTTLPPVPAVVAAPAPANPKQAISETTAGSHYQRGGPTRDPFVPLPKAKTAAAAATSSGAAKAGSSSSTASTETKSTGGSSTGSTGGGSGAGGGSGGSGSSGGSGGSGGSTPTTGNSSPSPTPSKPKPKPVYRVALQFGVAPPPGQNPQLTPYTDLDRVTPLPSKQDELVAFAGVGPTGKGAYFTLLQPAILKGSGVCLPSASQCESVDIAMGQTEELSFVNAAGQPVVYLLQVVSIDKGEAAAHEARARNAHARGARVHVSISYVRHGTASDHRRRVARSRAHLHS
jgi:hypothetical protein